MVNHVRFEMDEDFMADPAAPFMYRHEASSGWGALDDFGVHPLSLILTLFGPVARVMCDMAKPYPARRTPEGEREVEVFDIATILLRLGNGASGFVTVSRTAWGRKGRIALQIFGSAGALVYDQERMNELKYYSAGDAPGRRGFRTILAGPEHADYAAFCPAPGHGLGINDLKVIEARNFLRAIDGGPAAKPGFDVGLRVQRIMDAMERSHASGSWTKV